MQKIDLRQQGKEALLLVVGCVVYAISMLIIDPIDLIPGSFLGVAAALHKLLGTPIGTVNFLINIPVILLCLKFFGPKMLSYTIIIMLGTSGLIDAFSIFAPKTMYMPELMIAIAGGIVMGIGAGILLAAGGTMAGTTALARFIQKYHQKWTVGNLLIIMDAVIIIIGAILLHNYMTLLYSLLYTVACSKTIDIVYKIFS